MGLNDSVHRSGLRRDTTPYYTGGVPGNQGMPYWPGLLAGGAAYFISQFVRQREREDDDDPVYVVHDQPAPLQIRTKPAVRERNVTIEPPRRRRAPSDEEWETIPKRGYRYRGRAPSERHFSIRYSKRV